MREAMVPFVATMVLGFVVYRWVADEFGRQRRLSAGAANAVLALLLLHGLLVALSALGGLGGLGLPDAVVPVAVLVAVGGAVLAIAAVRALGTRERFFAMRVDGLVSHGAYRIARHPFYLGWSAMLLGFAFAGRSAVALTLVAVAMTVLFRAAKNEERWLAEELGEAYESYRAATPALLGRPKRLPAASGRPASHPPAGAD